MCFTFDEWHQKIKQTDAFWDEADLNKRMAMHGDTKKFLKEVKDNRAQNRIQGVAFNLEFDLDEQVKWTRVLFRVHKPERGVMELYSPRVIERNTRTGRVRVGRWVICDRWKTVENSGSWWVEYLQRKQDHMDNHGVQKAPSINEVGVAPVIEDILAAVREG